MKKGKKIFYIQIENQKAKREVQFQALARERGQFKWTARPPKDSLNERERPRKE